MAVSDWSTTASLNVTIDGINIAEDCAPGNINDAIRAIMANVRVMYNALPDTSTYVLKTGGTFTGNPKFNGAGGYLYNASSNNGGGKIFVQASGGSTPSMSNGDWLAEY